MHADIEDEGQTVILLPPPPNVPQTGDESNLSFWIGLGAIALDYRKHGQFEFVAPAILFACQIFTLTAPLYIWSIL